MSAPGSTDYSKGSFNRLTSLKKFRDNFDGINWSPRPQNIVLIEGEALRRYVEEVEQDLGPINYDEIVKTFPAHGELEKPNTNKTTKTHEHV